MKEELFIESIEAIKKQYTHDKKCSEAFSIILPNDHISFYDNNILMDQLIKVLSEMVGDKSDWIDYYIYELDFGKNYKDYKVILDNKEYFIKTPKDLYNLIKM